MSAKVGPPVRRATPTVLERYAWLGLVAACLSTLLLTTRNSLAPEQGPLTFGLAFGLAFAAAYLVIALAGALVALLIARLPGLSGLPRLLLMLAVGAVCLVVLRYNLDGLAASLNLSGPWRFRILAPLAFAANLLALVPLALAPSRWQRAVRLACLAALVATAASLWPPFARTSGQSTPLPSSVHMAKPPLLLIGLDGADWDWIEPLMARGELPHLAALRARGCWGRLSTQKPTLSPPLWTTIATGRSPDHHGIQGFAVDSIRGVHQPLPRLKPIRLLGFPELLAALRRTRLIDGVPVSSDLRRVPAYWNVATQEGTPVNLVNWWVTWPAEPILGAVVSERVYYRPQGGNRLDPALRLTFPPALLNELQPLLMRREDVTLADARRFMEVDSREFEAMRGLSPRERTLAAQFTYFYSMSETDRRVALHLTRTGRQRHGRAPDLLVLFRMLDMVCHTSLVHSELVDDHLDASPADVRRYGRAVTEAHRFLDRALGELIAEVGEEANVVLVSDHGFDLESYWPDWRREYAHAQGAQGVFLAAGPAFRPGKVEGLSILDVLPLLVEVKGFPLAQDLEGRPAAESLGELYVASSPSRRVPSYGVRTPPRGDGAASGTEQEQLDRLRALGYLD